MFSRSLLALLTVLMFIYHANSDVLMYNLGMTCDEPIELHLLLQ